MNVLSVARVHYPGVVEYLKGLSHRSERTTDETVVRNGVAPLIQSLQSHGDHEMPMDQPNLLQTKECTIRLPKSV